MEINKILFYGILIIIVLLLVFNARIYYLKEKFDKYCTIQYKNDSCPCISQRQTNLTLPYIQTNSPS